MIKEWNFRAVVWDNNDSAVGCISGVGEWAVCDIMEFHSNSVNNAWRRVKRKIKKTRSGNLLVCIFNLVDGEVKECVLRREFTQKETF
jgi:hypothetical protein